MKVAFIDFRNDYAGGQLALLRLVTHMTQISPLVITPPGAPLSEHARAAGIDVCEVELGTIKKTVNPLRLGRMAFERIPATARLCRVFRQHGVEVAWANNFYGVMAAWAAARIRRVPLVWWRHDSGIPENVILRSTFRACDAVFAIARCLRDEYCRFEPSIASRCHILRAPVDTGAFQPLPASARDTIRQRFGYAPENVVVACVCHLRKPKAVDEMVQMAAYLREQQGGVALRYLVVGDGDEMTNLRNLAVQLNVEDIVTFTGMRNDVPDLLGASDVFYLPSVQDNTPLSIGEAMACRLPVVATRTGGIPEMVINNRTGYLVEQHDWKKAGEHIMALSDARLREMMGISGQVRLHTEGFAANEAAVRAEELVGKLLYERNRARRGDAVEAA